MAYGSRRSSPQTGLLVRKWRDGRVFCSGFEEARISPFDERRLNRRIFASFLFSSVAQLTEPLYTKFAVL